MSGISRGKATPLVPLIGFTRVEEGLDSFGTKDFIRLIPQITSYCLTFLISLTSTQESNQKTSEELASLLLKTGS